MNLLFICSKNQWRSRTAETIFKNNGKHLVKSAGTSNTARIKLTQWHLDWADLIFVMEQKHRTIIQSKFQIASSDERLIVLDIPDEYSYMDEALIAELETVVAYYLEK